MSLLQDPANARAELLKGSCGGGTVSRASCARPGRMMGRDPRSSLQIRDGPRQLKDPMVRAGSHAQLLHRCAEQAAAGTVHLAELPYLGYAHVRIAGQGPALEANPLRLSRALDPRPDSIEGLAQVIVGQLVVRLGEPPPPSPPRHECRLWLRDRLSIHQGIGPCPARSLANSKGGSPRGSLRSVNSVKQRQVL